MNQGMGWNECENSHTLTTTTKGSKNSKKSQQSDKQSEQCSVPPPPKGSFFTDSWSWMKSSARHTLSNQQAQLQQLRLVNLTENAAITLSRILVWLL